MCDAYRHPDVALVLCMEMECYIAQLEGVHLPIYACLHIPELAITKIMPKIDRGGPIPSQRGCDMNVVLRQTRCAVYRLKYDESSQQSTGFRGQTCAYLNF